MARDPKSASRTEGTYTPQRLMIEIRPPAPGAAMAATSQTSLAKAIEKAGGKLDTGFDPVFIPTVTAQDAMAGGFDNSTRFAVDENGAGSMILVADGDEKVADAIAQLPEVIGVFADVPIEPCLICPGNPPLGNSDDVKRLLCTSDMSGKGMDGNGVLLAIVDTGINLGHLQAKGVNPAIDAGRSWVPGPGMTPFTAPVDHGTMCAFDALLAAPKATLLDIQLLRSQVGGGFAGFLSEAVRAYQHLRMVMTAPMRPGESRSLVVNNSWGMFHPTWDFPPGDPRNYSDNPNHPFNRAVAALEAAGADILFAAGNCGADCPDGRCQGVTANTIYGANGHPSVLTIGGVDTTKQRVGYSSQGPGRLSRNKPDVCGYTHFSGSGVYAADGGTSAACPVVAGVVAAIRSRKPFVAGNPSASPHAVRELIRTTAQDLSPSGFDFNTGWGVVDGCAIARRFIWKFPRFDICKIMPWMCKPPFPDLCRRYPHLCNPIPPRFPPGPGPFPPGPGPFPPGPGPRGLFAMGDEMGDGDGGDMDETDLISLMQMVYYQGMQAAGGGEGAGPKPAGGCGCGCGGKKS